MDPHNLALSLVSCANKEALILRLIYSFCVYKKARDNRLLADQ